MFKLEEIKELIHLLDETSVHEFEWEHEGSKMKISKPNLSEAVTVHAPMHQAPVQLAPQAHAPTPVPQTDSGTGAAPNQEDDPTLHKIVSPMVGTFYQSPSPDSPSFVNVGDSVQENSVVCIVEAMKLMNEIEAEVKGEVVKILVENGQLVEFGQTLFLIKKQ